jgi:arginase family enzyme
MIENMIAVYSEETKTFAKERFKKSVPRRRYNSRWPLLSSQIPCFLAISGAEHAYDADNIRATLRRNHIGIDDVSLVVFDKHTDMYTLDTDKGREVIRLVGKENSANWLLYMLKRGYSGVSLVGVEDFTEGHKESDNPAYHDFRDRIRFFVSDSFDKQKEFGQKECGFELSKVQDFSANRLRKYSFISLDCDVSGDFSPHPTYCRGQCGNMSLDAILAIIEDVRRRSQIVGFSIFGVSGGPSGFFNSFHENKRELERVLEPLIAPQPSV